MISQYFDIKDVSFWCNRHT